MKFTKEEISLCKQVAEKHRKDIKYGDWYWSNSHNKPLIAIAGGFKANEQKHFGVFKIWTISDCLEFMKSKSFYGSISNVGSYYETYYKKMIIGENDEDKSIKVYSGIVKTPLEACLKAVLAVLEESK